MTKTIQTWLLLCLSSVSSTSALANTPTTITLPMQQVILQYNQSVRLDRVLLDAQQQANQANRLNTYHESYRLFSYAKADETQELYADVRERLNALLNNDTYRVAAKQLLTQLSEYQYGYREKLNLDVDAVRLKPELNPLLSGQFQLELAQRPDSITLFGLSEQQQMTFNANFTVADYIVRSHSPHKKNHSYTWVISPEGEITHVGYAYWNNAHTHLKPGSALLVGFNASDQEMVQLEQDIATLISMIEGYTL
ncbi:capsule biosynthesis GfcC family protein [Vibrio fluvialis]|uniref:capsule biosynthesis GfcC family protein n=1 Tax=Vibrio fluvialis TaxID=676 RepID=UPI00192CA9F2|nr:capsule biosynthesis GfcC family protein [Vibrio fluvialis]MBL4297101.1 capsule biosynthesis GfcC family protein [Vibrio fluvialis]